MEETSTLPFLEAFIEFLKANGLDPFIYSGTDSTPRFIRYMGLMHLLELPLQLWISQLEIMFLTFVLLLNDAGRSISLQDAEILKEWTSRRTWKERKRAAWTKENYSSQQPELIFYGRNSGVVGLGKVQLYQNVSDNEILSCGYDKVLVDAECTQDGSIKYIQKFGMENSTTSRIECRENMDSLTMLQFNSCSE